MTSGFERFIVSGVYLAYLAASLFLLRKTLPSERCKANFQGVFLFPIFFLMFFILVDAYSKHEAPKKNRWWFQLNWIVSNPKVQLSALTHSANKTPQTDKHQPLLKQNTHTHNASLPQPSRNTTSWTCWCFPPSLLFQSHHDLERRVRLSLLRVCHNHLKQP